MNLSSFSLLKILTPTVREKTRFLIFSKFFFENCAFYGLDTEPEPELS
jgi:hypothetical protein